METLSLLAVWAQIFSLPIAVIAICVSIWLYIKSRQKRAIACVFEQIEFPIEIKAGDAYQGDIEILYKGRPVRNIFLLRVKIKNTGTIAIHAADVFSPLTFSFQKDCVLLREPRTIVQMPANLLSTWGLAAASDSLQELRFEFDLLNPGDELIAEFTCTGNPTTPLVQARIDGIREIETIDSEERQLSKRILDGLYIPIAILLPFFFTLIQRFLPTGFEIPRAIATVVAGLMLIGLLLLVAVMLWSLWAKFLQPLLSLVKYRIGKKKKANKPLLNQGKT